MYRGSRSNEVAYLIRLALLSRPAVVGAAGPLSGGPATSGSGGKAAAQSRRVA